MEDLDLTKNEQKFYFGCKHEEWEPHICPFNEDIYGDSETLCTCCPDCENQCLSDI